jgi:hypothetical protein
MRTVINTRSALVTAAFLLALTVAVWSAVDSLATLNVSASQPPINSKQEVQLDQLNAKLERIAVALEVLSKTRKADSIVR